MNRRKLLSLLGISPALLASSAASEQEKSKTPPQATDIAERQAMASNPKGTPPPVKLVRMAPRLATLDGKTIYLVDTGFMGGGTRLQQMQTWA
jgi:hypothetical protein